MVLGQSFTDKSGRTHKMAGRLGPAFSFAERKLNLGYRDARLAADPPLRPAGARLRGHEFHYATAETAKEADPPFAFVRDAHGGAEQPEGSRRKLVSGGFFHIIAAGSA